MDFVAIFVYGSPLSHEDVLACNSKSNITPFY